MIGEILGWLAQLVASEKIKEQFGKRGLNKETRILKEALEDSQNFRAEYADALQQVHRIAADRDHYHSEMMKLRIEVAQQEQELAKLRKKLAKLEQAQAGAAKPASRKSARKKS